VGSSKHRLLFHLTVVHSLDFFFSGFFVAPYVLSAVRNCRKLFLTLNVLLRFQPLTNTVADGDKSYDDDTNGDVV